MTLYAGTHAGIKYSAYHHHAHHLCESMETEHRKRAILRVFWHISPYLNSTQYSQFYIHKKIKEIIGKVQLWRFLITNVGLTNCDYTCNSVTMETAKIPHFQRLQFICKCGSKYAFCI